MLSREDHRLQNDKASIVSDIYPRFVFLAMKKQKVYLYQDISVSIWTETVPSTNPVFEGKGFNHIRPRIFENSCHGLNLGYVSFRRCHIVTPTTCNLRSFHDRTMLSLLFFSPTLSEESHTTDSSQLVLELLTLLLLLPACPPKKAVSTGST